MFTYSTCRSCSTPLIVTRDGQREHDGCTPRLTAIEKLTADYLFTVEHHGDEAAQGLATAIMEMQNKDPQFHAAARAYATSYGWPIFPLKPQEKAPATKNGFKDATTDLAQIDKWWDYNPEFNIGIATGHFFDVIDVDPPRGWESWHSIQKTVLPDIHARVATQSGGAHFYIMPTGGGNRAGIYPGIDYRAMGGYVIAPPSWLGQHRYSWSWGVYPSPFILPAMREAVHEWQQQHA